jgi:hypothetical protein
MCLDKPHEIELGEKGGIADKPIRNPSPKVDRQTHRNILRCRNEEVAKLFETLQSKDKGIRVGHPGQCAESPPE